MDGSCTLTGIERHRFQIAVRRAQGRVRTEAQKRLITVLGNDFARQLVGIVTQISAIQLAGHAVGDHPHRRTRRPIQNEDVGQHRIAVCSLNDAGFVVGMREGFLGSQKRSPALYATAPHCQCGGKATARSDPARDDNRQLRAVKYLLCKP